MVPTLLGMKVYRKSLDHLILHMNVQAKRRGWGGGAWEPFPSIKQVAEFHSYHRCYVTQTRFCNDQLWLSFIFSSCLWIQWVILFASQPSSSNHSSITNQFSIDSLSKMLFLTGQNMSPLSALGCGRPSEHFLKLLKISFKPFITLKVCACYKFNLKRPVTEVGELARVESAVTKIFLDQFLEMKTAKVYIP